MVVINTFDKGREEYLQFFEELHKKHPQQQYEIWDLQAREIIIHNEKGTHKNPIDKHLQVSVWNNQECVDTLKYIEDE